MTISRQVACEKNIGRKGAYRPASGLEAFSTEPAPNFDVHNSVRLLGC